MYNRSQIDFVKNAVLNKAPKRNSNKAECSNCQSAYLPLTPCKLCHKTLYCSTSCEEKHSASHTVLCSLLRPLQNTPGYNDYLGLPMNVVETLKIFGETFLSVNNPGVVGITEYPRSQKENLDSTIRAFKGNTGYAENTVHQTLVHYYILPLSCIVDLTGSGGFSEEFINLVKHPLVFDRLIPIVKLKLVDTHIDKLQFAVVVI